jgi:hypothetical protein
MGGEVGGQIAREIDIAARLTDVLEKKFLKHQTTDE